MNPLQPPHPYFQIDGLSDFLETYARLVFRELGVILVLRPLVAVPIQWAIGRVAVSLLTATGLQDTLHPFFAFSSWLRVVVVILIGPTVQYAVSSPLFVAIAARSFSPRRSIRDALIQGVKRSPFAAFDGVLMILLVMLGLVCLVVPGTYLALRLFPAPMIEIFQPGEQPIRHAWELNRDSAFQLFLALAAVGVLSTPASQGIG